MARAPFVIAALVMGSTIVWAIHLAVEPDPFAPSSAVVVAGGLVAYGVIATAGLLVVRGMWARWLAGGVVGATVILAVVTQPGPFFYLGLTCSALAVVGLSGPWLKGWIRKLPSATGPGPIPMAVALGALFLVPAVGLASPSGLEVAHGVLGGTGLLLAWGYSRAHAWALWGLRLALPVLAIGAIVQSPPWGRVLLGALVATVVALAWTKDARLAVQPLMDQLPGPRVATPPRDAP